MRLSEEDLRIAALAEALPLDGNDLPEDAGISLRTFRHHLLRLQRLGFAGWAVAVDPRGAGRPVGALLRLRIDWSRLPCRERLEARMAADPAVARADLVMGKCDYQLCADHPDVAAAQNWAADWRAEPGVREAQLSLVTHRWRRLSIAAALAAKRRLS